MAKVRDIYQFIDGLAPFRTQMSFDNSGFLLGRWESEVTKVLISLDITPEVVEEAKALGAEVIVSHHPVIFHPTKSLTDRDATGRLLLSLLESSIAVISAHTNLDIASGGVNDALAHALELERLSVLYQESDEAPKGQFYPIGGLGRVGVLKGDSTMGVEEFAHQVKTALNASGIRFLDAGRPVNRVAVGGGACADLIPHVLAKGCDTFVTSDIKYNVFLEAKETGLNLIDAGHFPTENVVCPALAEWLTDFFKNVEVRVSQVHKEVFSCL